MSLLTKSPSALKKSTPKNGRVGGNFYGAGRGGNWWNATEYNADYAWDHLILNDNAFVSSGYDGKALLYSVRCVVDKEKRK